MTRGTSTLLTPDNCVLMVIDHQPRMAFSVQSIDRRLMVNNVVEAVAQTGRKDGVMAGLWTEVCLAFPA